MPTEVKVVCVMFISVASAVLIWLMVDAMKQKRTKEQYQR